MGNNLLTYTFGLLSAFLAVKWQSSAKENELLKQKLSEKKEELYSEFIKMYMSMLNKETSQSKDMVKQMREFNEKLILVGSNKVVLTYGDLMQSFYKNDIVDTATASRLLGELILAMREDLGHRDFWNNLMWFDPMRPWIKDIGKMLPEKYRGLRRVYSKYLSGKIDNSQ